MFVAVRADRQDSLSLKPHDHPHNGKYTVHLIVPSRRGRQQRSLLHGEDRASPAALLASNS